MLALAFFGFAKLFEWQEVTPAILPVGSGFCLIACLLPVFARGGLSFWPFLGNPQDAAHVAFVVILGTPYFFTFAMPPPHTREVMHVFADVMWVLISFFCFLAVCRVSDYLNIRLSLNRPFRRRRNEPE
jgi:hypothetical protein